MGDNELEQFKADINLIELASSYGYELVKRECSRASIVMLHPDGDKVVIATAADGHGIFFSVRDNRCSGSVIDFVMHRESANLGVARLILRNWLRPGRPQNQIHCFKPEVISSNMPALYTQWLRMRPYSGSGYLEWRGLDAGTIAAFSDRIRQDQRGNVVFRHDDLHSFTGFEMKNRGFTGFSGGGRKALFAARIGIDGASVPLVVITESAIDAMSYYQLKPEVGSYLSFAGAISVGQQELLAWIVNRYPDARIIAATDNDAPGEKYASLLCQMRSDIVRDRPPIGKDWNDALNGRNARPGR